MLAGKRLGRDGGSLSTYSEETQHPVTPDGLRSLGDYYAAEAHLWVEETAGSRATTLPGPEIATVMAILAVYTEIRRLGDILPTAEDMRGHAAAMRTLSNTMIDHGLAGR